MKLHAITLTFIPQNNICYGCPIFKTTCQLPVWGLSKIGRLPANFLYQGNKIKPTFFVFIVCVYVTLDKIIQNCMWLASFDNDKMFLAK